ncbi:MAG: hypothetical protein HZB92_08330 [Euryarchaeota archaeon]|nr:hypothetical protein [Euryarchaeota archaeon]
MGAEVGSALGSGQNQPVGMTPSEVIEYETCTALIQHYEKIRMELLHFFATFNGILIGFLAYIYSTGKLLFESSLSSGILIMGIGLFAFIVCLTILNGEIREMTYWTVLISRARIIEQEVNKRNKITNDEPSIGYMDTYRRTYREIIIAGKLLKGGKEDGYATPEMSNNIWKHGISRTLGGSRTTAMRWFYSIMAIGWVIVAVYGVILTGELIWRILGLTIIISIIIASVFFLTTDIDGKYIDSK